MVTDQSSVRRFRIERLEERIAPASSFWTDSLLGRMVAEWFVGNEVDNSERLNGGVPSLAGSQVHQVAETVMAVDITDGAFPVWASEMLDQFENGRVGSPETPGTVFVEALAPNVAGSLQSDSPIAEDVSHRLPAWAERMLADVGQVAQAPSSAGDAGSQIQAAQDLDAVMRVVAAQNRSRTNVSADQATESH